MELKESLLTKSDWSLVEDAIVVFCQSETEARSRILNVEEYRVWSEMAYRFGVASTKLYYPQTRKTGKYFEIKAIENTIKNEVNTMNVYENAGVFPSLILNTELPLTKGIRRALDTIAEHPNEKWVLLRLSPNLESQKQVAMTQSMQACIVGATVQQALNRDRTEYFDLADLEKIKSQTRLTSVGQSFRTQWKGYSPITKGNWREFSYSYTTVDIVGGYIWQLGQNHQTSPIAVPV